jgi:hypothetical protein
MALSSGLANLRSAFFGSIDAKDEGNFMLRNDSYTVQAQKTSGCSDTGRMYNFTLSWQRIVC